MPVKCWLIRKHCGPSFLRKEPLILVTFFFVANALPHLATAENATFYSSPDFTLTETDVRLYLSAEVAPDGTVLWGSPERVQQAISELYVLKVLGHQASQEALLSEEEMDWIAYYQVALAGVRRLVYGQIEEKLRDHDWSREAREYYLANQAEFASPESISIRTMLLKTDSRSFLDAAILAESLLERASSEEDFAQLVIEYTEDPGNLDGRLDGVTRGQTVPQFEKAAFSLQEPGAMSQPVLTEYGVHLIQLLDRKPPSTQPFEAVEAGIIASLRQKRFDELATYVRTTPHRQPPANVIRHDDQIATFLKAVALQQAESAPKLPVPE